MKRPDVEIINRQNIFEITEDLEKLIKKAVKTTLECEGVEAKCDVDVQLVNNRQQRELNARMRNISKTTAAGVRQGSISEINPLVDANGMVKVKAAVNGQGKLFSGMNVRVSVKRSLGEQLVIPKTAVVLRSGKQVVFTLKEGTGKIQKRTL